MNLDAFNIQNISVRYILSAPSSYKMRKLRNREFEVSQLVSGRGRIWAQEVGTSLHALRLCSTLPHFHNIHACVVFNTFQKWGLNIFFQIPPQLGIAKKSQPGQPRCLAFTQVVCEFSFFIVQSWLTFLCGPHHDTWSPQSSGVGIVIISFETRQSVDPLTDHSDY